MFYGDLNPKRAFIVSHPEEYKWSSYKHYAFGEMDPLIDEPECYLNLGLSPEARQLEYRKMVDYIVKHDWKDKQNYSNVAFIGNPEWVTGRYYELRQELKRLREMSQIPSHPERLETGLSP